MSGYWPPRAVLPLPLTSVTAPVTTFFRNTSRLLASSVTPVRPKLAAGAVLVNATNRPLSLMAKCSVSSIAPCAAPPAGPLARVTAMRQRPSSGSTPGRAARRRVRLRLAAVSVPSPARNAAPRPKPTNPSLAVHDGLLMASSFILCSVDDRPTRQIVPGLPEMPPGKGAPYDQPASTVNACFSGETPRTRVVSPCVERKRGGPRGPPLSFKRRTCGRLGDGERPRARRNVVRRVRLGHGAGVVDLHQQVVSARGQRRRDGERQRDVARARRGLQRQPL